MQYRLVDKSNYNLKHLCILVKIIIHTYQKTYVRGQICRQQRTQRRGSYRGKRPVYQEALGLRACYCDLRDMLCFLKLPRIDFI